MVYNLYDFLFSSVGNETFTFARKVSAIKVEVYFQKEMIAVKEDVGRK